MSEELNEFAIGELRRGPLFRLIFLSPSPGRPYKIDIARSR